MKIILFSKEEHILIINDVHKRILPLEYNSYIGFSKTYLGVLKGVIIHIDKKDDLIKVLKSFNKQELNKIQCTIVKE